MPGPAIKLPAVPDWADPNQASVFDMPGQGFLRQAVHLLGLDDPTTQAQMLMNPMEVGPVGGAMGAIAAKLPRFLKAVQSVYRAPTAEGRVAAPFYSRLDEAAATLPKQTFGPKVLGVVQKGQASGEELAARRVPEFVAGYGNKPIQRAALAAHLEAHPVPELQVKILGVQQPPRLQIIDRGASFSDPAFRYSASPDGTVEVGSASTPDLALAKGADFYRRNQRDTSKFSKYQLPGGTNYRETLITLPKTEAFDAGKLKIVRHRQSTTQGTAELVYDDRSLGRFGDDGTPDTNWMRPDAQWQETARKLVREDGAFKSGHFDEPNILVHTRSNERELPGLGKGTFLEEVQSDWHQKGKAEGYRDEGKLALTPDEQELRAINARTWDRSSGIRTEADVARARELKALVGKSLEDKLRLISSQIPDAPFKETWPDLALKHHLAEAAQNPEVQWLGFTGGETQAARYDLSKQISRVEFHPNVVNPDGRGRLKAWGSDGRQVMEEVMQPEKVPDYIGKEASERLLKSAMSGGDLPFQSLSGVDLKVGGEGMHEFYDKLLPKRLEKIVKPFGGTVERVQIPNKTSQEPGWIVRLTPELKKRLLEQGLPLMTGVAAAGATVPNSEGP